MVLFGRRSIENVEKKLGGGDTKQQENQRGFREEEETEFLRIRDTIGEDLTDVPMISERKGRLQWAIIDSRCCQVVDLHRTSDESTAPEFLIALK